MWVWMYKELFPQQCIIISVTVLLLRLLYPFIDRVLSEVYSNNCFFGGSYLSVDDYFRTVWPCTLLYAGAKRICFCLHFNFAFNRQAVVWMFISSHFNNKTSKDFVFPKTLSLSYMWTVCTPFLFPTCLKHHCLHFILSQMRTLKKQICSKIVNLRLHRHCFVNFLCWIKFCGKFIWVSEIVFCFWGHALAKIGEMLSILILIYWRKMCRERMRKDTKRLFKGCVVRFWRTFGGGG